MALNKRKVLETARKYAQKGAKAKALKEYNKLLQADPRDAKLLLEVGDAYRRWGQAEEAIAQYSKVAQQYRQDGFDARAVAVFKQILNLDPKHYSAYVSLSELYQRMGLDSEAIAALQTAADGFHKEGRKSEALDLLRQMAALDPTNTTSRLKVAELLRQEDMSAEALAEYEAVAAELESQQDRDQLIKVLERILEIDPDQVKSLVVLVRQLMAMGELDRAEPLAVHALDVATEPAQYELLIELYTQRGDDAKLADATRSLAKLYRERGDEEKARILMQRLPSEGVDASTSASRLAVDVSEVAEPDLADEELLDEEPFLTLDDEGATETDFGTAGIGTPFADQDEIELETPTAADEAAAPAPLPEGDPDQLLAEASVYLRYGKRDQAIASLRSVLAQDPDHRGALEKLGEAYAEGGESNEAVAMWSRAAEQMRVQGDADALAGLRERIAALDPAAAEQLGAVAGTTDDPQAASETAGLLGEDLTETAVPDVELDMEVDLDLDSAIEEMGDEDAAGRPAGALDDDVFEIELSDDSVTFDATAIPSDASPGLDSPVEETTPDLGLADETGDEPEFEFELDDDVLGGDVTEAAEVGAEPAEASSGLFEIEDNALVAPGDESLGGHSTTTTARINEELEEAEFYIGQDMFDEAEGILQRILELVPNHPSALLRLGEIAAARGDEPDLAGVADLPSEVADATRTVTSDRGADFELDLSDDALDPSEATGPILEEPDALSGTPAAAAAEPEAELEEIPVEPELDTDASAIADEEATQSEPAGVDAGETFDLREALADVLAEDDEDPPDPKGDSGVLSTVEDGFESIFSDFKKGVSAQLDDGDFDTRYDLGIAYREMGLYEDAIAEFRVCLDCEARRFDSLYLMGLCARDLQRFEDAVNHLEQALALPDLPTDRMPGVYFDLSIAQEGQGDHERACASVQRVVDLEPGFPGAAERLAALLAGRPAPELADSSEDFESFDELFAEGDDEHGDEAMIEAVPVETFESFDDLVSEAEADVAHDSDESDAAGDNGDSATRKSGRKKISFV